MEIPARSSPQGDGVPSVLGTEPPFYRCLFLQTSGGVDKVDIVDAVSDEDALFRAVKLVKSQSECVAVEIWEGARKVFPATRARADVEQLKRALSAMG